jgi:hypothetical protein
MFPPCIKVYIKIYILKTNVNRKTIIGGGMGDVATKVRYFGTRGWLGFG